MRARRLPLIVLSIVLLLAALLAVRWMASPQPFSRLAGLLLDPRLTEVSGLAASRRHAGVLWAINDGGNGAQLHAIGTRGQHRASLLLDGIANTDWEDLAAFELDGVHYLLVADTGDNGGLRHTLQLHAVAEPARVVDGAHVATAWTIAFRWPDGPRDCEAIAVDEAAGQVLLVSKRRNPVELFAVPLRPGDDMIHAARRLGTLAGVPRASEAELQDDPERARLRGQVTAVDLSPDGRTLAVMTYDDVLFYRRHGDEGWPEAVARAPEVHPLALLPQGEALAWSADGRTLHATGEFRPSPLLRLTPGPL